MQVREEGGSVKGKSPPVIIIPSYPLFRLVTDFISDLAIVVASLTKESIILMARRTELLFGRRKSGPQCLSDWLSGGSGGVH